MENTSIPTAKEQKIVSIQTEAAPTGKMISSNQTHQTVSVPIKHIAQPLGQNIIRVEYLGNNKIITKDGNQIVQGPDPVEAIAIALKIQNGEAILTRITGKQCLLILGAEKGIGRIQQVKGGPNNNNDASSTAPSAKRLCTELKK